MVMIREGDDRRPGIAQLVDQLRDHAARPGPLANLLEAVVVDIDNVDRRVTGLARSGLLIKVEAERRKSLEQIGGGESRDHGHNQNRKRQ